MKKKYQQREELRNEIKQFWKDGRTFKQHENNVVSMLNAIHAEIVAAEILDKSKPLTRSAYSVCGWSEKHGFFRNKRFSGLTIEQAQEKLSILKTDTKWRIPTIIVKETWLREKSPAMVDFDGDIDQMGFSYSQELIEKHMCGNRHFRWKDLIFPSDSRYTY